ncbi:CHAT domain-containing protein [Nostoc sp. ChiQUE01b]|uniref:CHAT domain-containing protein n=1 Tax=Nostoc sp. ChiQUE01b TaxID=3075376 RepID=UPI002AD2A1E2|nr:CHAT domain-containing protein [Nostoc sp. ChiQUE01b]MDZ8236946.1 CHAT domain-containing protein [Nostoc sp. ChiQUE01a]MDZ8262674.1 CHAT domain-containing protein [Nostoc sp. ChiQUE01b]MDZ8262706.1 CHAT domain-containing protein [Nostoc sp. ChiQUE01b]
MQLTSPQLSIGKLVQAQAPDADQLVNKGVESYQAGNFRAAIQSWKAALELYTQKKNYNNVAIANENLARTYQQLGENEQALSYWEQVNNYYRSQQNWQKVGRILTEIAQAYSSFGQTGKAINFLCGVSDAKNIENLACQQGSALKIASEQQDKAGEIAALGSLGEAYRLRGNYDVAIQYLEAAKKTNNQTYNFAILNSLGNAHASRAQLWNLRTKSAQQQSISKAREFQQKAKNDYQQALEYFQSSLKEARQQDNKSGEIRSLLNLIQLFYHSKTISLIPQNQLQENIQESLELLDKLPDSMNKVYAAINLANLPAVDEELTSPLTQCLAKLKLPNAQAKELFNKAINISQRLQDSRSESYALGALGHFYECQEKKYQQAWELTNKAIWLADQKLKAKDSLYLWEWQAGRVLEAQNRNIEALPFYQRAYNILEELRSDILIADRDFQFDFRDIIEPVYRQLAQLQLEFASASNTSNKQLSSPALNAALTTINSLRLAEIQNYFGNDCILTAINNKNVTEVVEDNTAFISSIVLKGKTGVILILPNQERHLQWIDKNQETLRQEITNFYTGLVRGKRDVNYNTKDAENLYELIIRPFEDDLSANKITTLVFIQDSFLRNVPMAALYDKKDKKYLIEKYAIASTPSLQLTSTQKVNIKSSRALILAVSQEAKIDDKLFEALTNVPLETKAVQELFANTKKLENQEFTISNLEQEIQNTSYPIIHVATHAQFGTIAEDTFLVTGNNDKLTINQLETLLRQTNNSSNLVELLALTACQTAVGDDRSTLGLAGVALQAGAKSAMASLWSVGDESTANLVAEFYSKLRESKMSKAQALQIAQLKLINAKETEIDIQYNHPYYWAPFILIGNWL